MSLRDSQGLQVNDRDHDLFFSEKDHICEPLVK